MDQIMVTSIVGRDTHVIPYPDLLEHFRSEDCLCDPDCLVVICTGWRDANRYFHHSFQEALG